MKNSWIGAIILTLGLVANGLAQDEEPKSQDDKTQQTKSQQDGKQGTAELPSLNAGQEPEPIGQPKGIEDKKKGNASELENGVVISNGDWNNQPEMPCGFYGSAEYLLWWMKKGTALPPLITHGDPNDTPTGALDQPGTTVLFGGNHFGSNPFSGGRFLLGYWFGNEKALGLEVGGFFLEQRRSFFNAASTGDPGTGSLNVVFFNGDGNFEDSFPQVALEGTAEGQVAIRLTQRLWGAEANLRCPFIDQECFRLSGLLGFRVIDLQESFDLVTQTAFLPTELGIATSLADSIATRNRFYGAQVGADADIFRGNFRLNLRAKLALGGTAEEVNISGATASVDPINGLVVAPGGYFTGPSNIGNHHRSEFAVAPEIGINLGYQFNQNICAMFGYTFLYLSDVVRPADQIDRTVTFQTNDHPAVLFQRTDFWVQGISVGLQIRF